MCNENNYNEIMKELAEMKAMQNEIATAVDELQNELKEYMQAAGKEVLQGNEHKATFKEVTSKRLDTKALKLDLPEVYDKYSKASKSMRFNFN